MMKDHYGFSDSASASLIANGVTEADLFRCVNLFDPNGSGEALTKVSLLYYVDKKGNFNTPPTRLKHKLIAKALFESLPITPSEKLMMLEYIDDATDGEF